MTDKGEFLLLKKSLENGFSTKGEIATKILGITPNMFSKKITGKNPFSVSDIKKLENALELSHEDIYEIFLA